MLRLAVSSGLQLHGFSIVHDLRFKFHVAVDKVATCKHRGKRDRWCLHIPGGLGSAPGIQMIRAMTRNVAIPPAIVISANRGDGSRSIHSSDLRIREPEVVWSISWVKSALSAFDR